MTAEAAVSSAVLKLGNLLKQKANFLRGAAGEDLQQLKEELKGVQCFLRAAAEKQADDERIRNWISETREVAHNVEDAVEVFMFKVERARMMLGNFASSPNHAYHLNKFSRVIKSVRKRLQGVEKSRRSYGIQDLGDRLKDGVGSSKVSENVEPLRRLAQWQKDKHVVGMEKDVELLLEKAILDEREGLSIAAVVGVGGIGKSTLARIVQNHAAFADRFELRAWAVASKEVRPRDVIKELLLQLRKGLEIVLKDKMEKLELPNLLELLYERLQGKRYFIVLDDVWDDALWDALANAFPDEGNGSRLLLTSRSPVMSDYTRYVHTMNCLDPDESWMLFSKTVSVNGRGLEDLEDIGRQILNKCNGVPLAITLVGGLLTKQRQSKSELEKVLKQMNSHLNRSSNDTMQAILELSYQNLPPELKSCFLCLGFFKGEATISARKLVDVWGAEGLISEETEEEKAMSYLEEMIDRNLVQIKDITIDGRVKSCQMHDLVHDLSITKAEEEISLEVVREDGKSESSHKPRHRVLYCSRGRFNDSIYGNKHIRSLVVRGARPYLYTTSFSSYWMSFRLLRVLDFEGCNLMTRLPAAISSLIGLRYLSLRDTNASDLPKWLPRLKNLRVLDLRGLHSVEMSEILGKMCNLRHLYANAFYFAKPPEITSLKNLQTLNYVNFNNADIFEVRHMTSLRKLGINLFRITDGYRLFYSLENLKNLVHLNLRYCKNLNLDKLGDMHRITRLKLHGDMFGVTRLELHGDEIPVLPSHFPPNVSHLSLDNTLLKEDPMPLLQKLPKLLYLKLRNAYVGEEMVISHDGFPGLKALSLHSMWSLRNILVEEGGMPGLRRLEINRCPCLENLPGERSGMSDLEELKIVASSKIASKVRGEDSHMISNIPYVQIIDDPRSD